VLGSKLRRKHQLPKPATLGALRDGLGIPYRTLLDAALTDKGWLPEPPVGGHGDPEVEAALDVIHEATRGQGDGGDENSVKNPAAS